MQEVKIIKINLENYPFIKKFFGNIIKQRLEIECFAHGMLTAHLLEPTELTEADLERLELVLQRANSCCTDLELIFKEDKLSQYQDADAKIIDMIAEVKTFEFLFRHEFSDITKRRHRLDAKTVDFTAKRNNRNYAVEVTRLGLAKSDDKQPIYDYKVSTLDYEKKCKDASGWEARRTPKEKLNVKRIENEIYDAVDHEYKQLRDFLKKSDNSWKGILVISSGQDYFKMRRYENKGYDDVCENDFRDALEKVWQSIKGEQKDKYLHYIVITRGKDLGKAIISPSFNKEQEQKL